MARLRWWCWLLAGGALAMLGGSIGWVATDHLEQDNDFCNACHLSPGVVLHRDVRREFDAVPVGSLAAVHGVAPVEGRQDAAFRCIDCHGGTGAVGRARVKLLAAKDAFWYVVGHFDEPDGMRWPLWDDGCRKCHPSFAGSGREPWEDPAFHDVALHNEDLGVLCVECHIVHDTRGTAEAYFLHPAAVRVQCARCHPEFEEK